MKRFFTPLVSLVMLFSVGISAQKKDRIQHLPKFDHKKIHFGYYLGLNQKGYKITYNDSNGTVNTQNTDYIVVDESIGFNIGLVIDYKVMNNINLRFEPGLSSNTKKITYSEDVLGPNGQNNGGLERDISGTYMRFPLLVKLSSNRLDNFRAFAIGGVSYDYNFSSNEKNNKDNFDRQFRMRAHNFMYEIGAGVDIYLPYFKFSPSIRGIFAINNELVPDNIASSAYTGPIDYFGTRGIFLNLTFE